MINKQLATIIFTFLLPFSAHAEIVINTFTIEYEGNQSATFYFDGYQVPQGDIWAEGSGYQVSVTSGLSIYLFQSDEPILVDFNRDFNTRTSITFDVVNNAPVLTGLYLPLIQDDQSVIYRAGPLGIYLGDDIVLGQEVFSVVDSQWDYSLASEVPVPAAAWLFGSALIGLLGIKRKR